MPATGDPTLRLRIPRNRDNRFHKRSMPATGDPTRINERAYEHDVSYMSHEPRAGIKTNSDYSVSADMSSARMPRAPKIKVRSCGACTGPGDASQHPRQMFISGDTSKLLLTSLALFSSCGARDGRSCGRGCQCPIGASRRL